MISIIIPVYNLEKYIKRTIDSVLAQTYQDMEVIAVDDGSSDGSGALIDQYSEKYPDKVRAIHIDNSGVTAARLTGISYAKGDWIGFVDGDDFVEPDMYERLLNNAIKYNADISHCGYQMIFDDGRVNYFYNTGCFAEQDNLKGQKDLLDGTLVEPGLCNKLYKRCLINELLQEEAMDVSIKINEDLLMNFILFSKSKKSIFEDFCPYHYIVRRSSASRQSINYNKIYDPINVKKKIVELSDENTKLFSLKAYMSTCISAYNSIICCKESDFKRDLKQVKKYIKQDKDLIKLLGKKQRLLAKCILYIPIIYKYMYRFYEKHFQVKPYD